MGTRSLYSLVDHWLVMGRIEGMIDVVDALLVARSIPGRCGSTKPNFWNAEQVGRREEGDRGQQDGYIR
jgi:hypothetical protein